MAFSPPSFNLTANIWRTTNFTYAAPDVVTPANLAYGRRNNPSSGSPDSQMSLLLPKLTDVRGTWNGVAADYVEVPAGSHRFYLVQNVDDSGKGFSNEHRIATMGQELSGLFGFAQPVPLP